MGILYIAAGFPFTAKAQYVIVPVGAPCPRSSRVDSDTVSYAVNQPMPFDQCFYLKCTLPGRVDVDKFIIIPVDALGKLKVKRRDYYSYLQNKTTRKARSDERRSLPYREFKQGSGLIAQQSERVTTVVKGNRTEITLDVPPLEPGREYKIKLLIKNDKDAKRLLEIGSIVFKSQDIIIPLSATDRANMLEEAALLHRRDVVARKQNPANELSNFEGFDTFVNTLYSFQLYFDAYSNHTSPEIDNSQTQPVIDYKLFFTSWAEPAPSESDLVALVDLTSPPISGFSRYHTISGNAPFTNSFDPAKSNSTLVIVDITPRINSTGNNLFINTLDTKGNQIDLASNSSYRVQALVCDTFSTTHLLEVGKLTFSQRGTHFEALPEAKANDGKWLEVNNSVMGNYSLIQEKQQLITTSLTSLGDIDFKANNLSYCMNSAVTCPCEDKGVKDLTARDQILSTLALLGEVDNKRRVAVAAGLSSIAELPKAVKPTEYVLRQANIKSSITSLNTVLEFIKKIQLMAVNSAVTADLAALIVQIDTYQLGLVDVSQNLRVIADAEAESAARLRRKLLGPNIKVAAVGSSSVLSLVSESKLRIIPDFGFILLFDRREPFSKSFGPKDLSPYLGFNIGFRAIDKNIPWRMIRHKSLRHHLSFMSGLTLKSLEVTGRREDFFGKTNLLVGLGYRLNNYLRITTGSVLFKAVDPNPFSDNRPVRASPFVGISLDVELKELFGGISTLFKI